MSATVQVSSATGSPAPLSKPMPKILPQVDLATLTKIAPADLRLLWVNDWYDGPLEAVVELGGDTCLMVLHDEDSSRETTYRWLLIRIDAEQRADLEKWHTLFVEHVGDHWCFHGPEIPHKKRAATTGSAQPKDAEPDPEKFYVPYRKRPALDFSRNAVVGWADAMPAH